MKVALWVILVMSALDHIAERWLGMPPPLHEIANLHFDVAFIAAILLWKKVI